MPSADAATGKRPDDVRVTHLVAAAAAGDRDAFDRLLRGYRAELFAFLRRATDNADDTEDLLQDTLRKVWGGLPAYRHHGKFRAWLYRVARNVVHDARRRRAVRAVVAAHGTLPEWSSADDPHGELEARELGQAIDVAITRLSTAQREVFLLRVHGGLTFQEIAREMNAPLNTVLSHMHRAMNALRKVLEYHDAI